MVDDIIFSQHAEVRTKERTSLSMQDIRTRLNKEIGVLVKETTAEPRFRYYVLWDSAQKKPLLVILRRHSENSWEVVTLYETMPYHLRGDRVIVLKRHISQARKHESRYKNESYPGGAKELKGNVRLYVIVRYIDNGKSKVVRHKVGSVPTHEFLVAHGGSAEKLLLHLGTTEQINNMSVPANTIIEVEAVETENNVRKVLSSWSSQE